MVIQIMTGYYVRGTVSSFIKLSNTEFPLHARHHFEDGDRVVNKAGKALDFL